MKTQGDGLVRNVIANSGCGDVDPLGVTSTPVADPTTDTLYVVGEISTGGGQPVRHVMAAVDIATVGPGGFFGELALLGGGPRTASVTAKTPMSVFVLSSAEFFELLREEPQVAVQMLPAIGRRIRETSERSGRPFGC